MRITIIGLPGSGKSTLAKAISEKLDIPHIHLDRFWFEAGGRNGAHDTPNIDEVRAYVDKRAQEAIASSSWVSDGFYNRLQSEIAERADVILYLNPPLTMRIWNHVVRTFTKRDRHPEVSFWDDITFLPEIIIRTFKTGPKLQKFVTEHVSKVRILKSRKQVSDYLQGLRSCYAGS